MAASGVQLTHQAYGALITLCARCGQSDRALEFFNEMVRSGIHPTPTVCNALITACGSAGY
jgi:pentatricopeptide repeat protein